MVPGPLPGVTFEDSLAEHLRGCLFLRVILFLMPGIQNYRKYFLPMIF
jgi:hypothetical protein